MLSCQPAGSLKPCLLQVLPDYGTKLDGKWHFRQMPGRSAVSALLSLKPSHIRGLSRPHELSMSSAPAGQTRYPTRQKILGDESEQDHQHPDHLPISITFIANSPCPLSCQDLRQPAIRAYLPDVHVLVGGARQNVRAIRAEAGLDIEGGTGVPGIAGSSS